MSEANRELNRLVWRTIETGDEAALVELDAACKAADGEEPVSRLPADALQAAASHPDHTLCVALGDQLAAVGWVKVVANEPAQQRIQLGGRVRPEFRRRGMGEALLAWAEQRAAQLALPGVTLQLFIASEALTEDANRLYLDYGYENSFSEWMLVCGLNGTLPELPLPSGMSEHAWDADSAPLFFQAYAAGFKDRLGETAPDEAQWIAGYTEDADFRPDLSRVALADGNPVGFVTCEGIGETGWVGQIAVAPEQRRKGLASALLAGALQRFRQAGCQEAALHVNANNAQAQAVFFGAGFTQRLVRAKFLKELVLPG